MKRKQKHYTLIERIQNGQKKFEALQLECNERGKELEHLNKVITAWSHCFEPSLHAEFRKALDPFIKRCTLVRDSLFTKYTLAGRSNKKHCDSLAMDCQYLRDAGCEHVGGFLCEYPDCELLTEWIRDSYYYNGLRNGSQENPDSKEIL